MSDMALADDIGGRFDHVLVDEYQDTNRLQSSILLALKPAGHGLTVVGDDAQSIYSFRAATVRNILDFPSQFCPPANIITLDRNYRSTQTILAAANGVIDLARERFTKNLWTDRATGTKPQLVSVRDEADQARCIVERVLENRECGTPLKEQAVLFRASHHSGPLEIGRDAFAFYNHRGAVKGVSTNTAHVGRTMATSRKISARRHAVRTFGIFVLGGILAAVGGGAPQLAAAEEVPAFAPGMIKHMQQMRRFEDVDKGPQPTPRVIPRFAAEPDPTGAVATFQPKGATFTFNNAFFKDLGTNGRTCFTCHQPQNGWSVSAADVAKRFAASAGADPIFRLVDGATCPNADVSTLAASNRLTNC